MGLTGSFSFCTIFPIHRLSLPDARQRQLGLSITLKNCMKKDCQDENAFVHGSNLRDTIVRVESTVIRGDGLGRTHLRIIFSAVQVV